MKRNKAKLYKRATISVISLVCIATGIATASFSFAWFSNRNDVTRDVKGYTAGAYFGGGDGTSTNPYIISRPIHLYNLAWLYYIGYFKGQEPYFSITSDLSMSGWSLPPIGTSTNPFNGHLEGNNKKVSGLTVSNDFNVLKTRKPSMVTEEDWGGSNTKYGPTPNVLGLFGYISKESSDKGIPSVENVLIDGETVNSTTSTALAGIAVGYVDGKLDGIYIDNSSLDLASNTSALGTLNDETISNVSEYTSVGYCTEDYRTKYTRYETTLYEPYMVSNSTYSPGGGGTSGDDYGGSIDVYSFYNKMSSVMNSTANPLTVSNDYAIPLKFDASSTSEITQGTGTPSSVTSSGTAISVSSYSKTLAADSSVNNIGYYSGAMAVEKNSLGKESFSLSDISSATNSTIGWNNATTNSLTTEESQKIVDALNSSESEGILGNSALHLTSSSFAINAAQTSTANTNFPSGSNDYTVIYNGTIGKEGSSNDYQGNIFIPKNGVWVAPRKAGRFQFIFRGDSSLAFFSTALGVARLIRKEAKNYSTGFTNASKYLIPTGIDWTYNIVASGARGKNYAYYGIDITEEDVENGYEYFIFSDSGSNSTFGYPYIVYLDIGDSGGDGSTTTTVTRTEVFELLEQITQAFTYPTGVYVTDFDNAVLDTKTLCITLGTTYSGEAKIDISNNQADLIVTTSSENNTGIGYYDPDFILTNNGTDISDSDLLEGDKSTIKTKRMTYYDYNQTDNTLVMFRFSQTTTDDAGTTYGNIETETQYKTTYADSTVGDWETTSGQTVYNNDGSSTSDTNGIPSSISSGISIPTSFSQSTNVFKLTLNKNKEDTFTNTYLPKVNLSSTTYYASTTGYNFTMKNGDTAISSSDYSISLNDEYTLTINDNTVSN